MREKKEIHRREEYANANWSWLDKYILTTPLYKKLVGKFKNET
jgi:hypothetical protein